MANQSPEEFTREWNADLANRAQLRHAEEVVARLKPRPSGPATPELAQVEAFERAVSNAATRLVFGHAPEAFEPPEPMFGGDSVLVRALATTKTDEVAGLIPSITPPGWVLRSIAARQSDAVALIAALRTATLDPNTGTPYVPDIPEPQAAGVQAGEKMELSSRQITVSGESVTPDLVGRTANLSWQVMEWAGDSVLLILGSDVYKGISAHIVAELGASAGTALADIPTAIGAVESAGWSPDLIVGSRSALATAISGASPEAYPQIVIANTGAAVFVASRAGIFCAVREPPVVFTVAEPSIGGVEASAVADVILTISDGAVARA